MIFLILNQKKNINYLFCVIYHKRFCKTYNPVMTNKKQKDTNPSFHTTLDREPCILDVLQRGMPENSKFVQYSENGKTYFYVAITKCTGGPGVSQKFAIKYNKKLLEERSNPINDSYYIDREPIELSPTFKNALEIPDDCLRHDPILIECIKEFLDNGDNSLNGEMLTGFPISNWMLVLVPIEMKNIFKIIQYEGGSEDVLCT